MVGGDEFDGGVEKRGYLGLRAGLRQGGKGAAADRVLLAGTQQDGGLDVRDPACGQRPGAGDVVGDVGGGQARGTEDLAQARADRLGEHRAEGGVAGCCGVHALAQGDHVGFGGAVDGGHAELGGHVHEQLVAA